MVLLRIMCLEGLWLMVFLRGSCANGVDLQFGLVNVLLLNIVQHVVSPLSVDLHSPGTVSKSVVRVLGPIEESSRVSASPLPSFHGGLAGYLKAVWFQSDKISLASLALSPV